MNDASSFPSLVQLQFRRAKAAICQHSPSVEQQALGYTKSSAQVALSVEHQGVERKACGLKPGKSKPYRLAVRLSAQEREIVVRHAQAANLTLSDYFRATILSPGYVSNVDPVKREMLKSLSRELGRQGTNLNQIAKRLNSGSSMEEASTALAAITSSLLLAHQAVREALTEGERYE